MSKRKKILLVDDSNTVLLMHRMLLKDDYDLVIATDGKTAIELALQERPDLIFMDLVMPRMSGIEACRALRSHPETRSTPVIMVTTRGEPQHIEASYAAGCNEYITKPFDSVELVAKLQSYLGTGGTP
jgi:CheY-like chemotaxis protein